MWNKPLSREEIEVHLKKLKNNKAAGYDGILSEFIKYAPENIVDMLYVLFNCIYDKGEWPDEWATGIISPIHKKESINVPDNYRKVTVMPVIGKVLESILNSRLVYHNIVLSLDDPLQFGFKEGCQTGDNMFILYSMIMRQRFKRKPLFVCFVDFTKAFDYVDRMALYYKLIDRGISGKMLDIIVDLYRKAKCRVKWKNRLGEEIASDYGVLQGGMLSPKLFTEFLTDLKQYLDQTCGIVVDKSILTYILYADDMVLCSDTHAGLQKLLDGLYKFCSNWHLIVSLAKTNIMAFGCNKKFTFKFGNEIISETSEYKYLGTIFTNRNKLFKSNRTNIENKTNRAIFSLQSYIKTTVGQLQPSLAIKMFDAQILPIIEYGSDIWYDNTELKSIETIHLSFLKSVLRTKTSTSTIAIYSELGRFPLHLRIKCKLLNFWNRIMSLDSDHIVRQSYNSLLQLHNFGQRNWCTYVHEILKETQQLSLWTNQNLDSKCFILAKEKLFSTFMKNCMDNINDLEKNPKLRTYKKFKNEFQLESYIATPKNLQHAIALFKFRTSAHNLAIETGRYTRPKTPLNERICLHCQNKPIEDEVHFLLQCPLYNRERKVMLDKIKISLNTENLNDDELFLNLMSCKDKIVTDALGQYIHNSMKLRVSPEI
jgi:hypothetical protein